jgi:GNAT superfamily N-acetyltransferase
MPGDAKIRDATVEDAEAMAIVHVRTWQAAYRGQIPDDHLDGLSIEDRTDSWREGLLDPDGPIRVAEKDGAVIGWACWGRTRDADVPDNTGELYGIYVLPDHWGSGIGPALMDEALAWLHPRFGVATLWTLDTNARARRFYERFGWGFDGTTKADDARGFVLNEVRYRIALRGD